MLSILPLALMAAIYPTLLAGVIVILSRPAPEPLLIAFLLGGWLISLASGLIIVFVLKGVVSTSDLHHGRPAVDIVAGVLSLLLAGFLQRRRKHGTLGGHRWHQEMTWRWRRHADSLSPDGGSSARHHLSASALTERTLNRGTAREAFVLGALLNLPGIWYLVALNEIAVAEQGAVVSVLSILLFNAIMFLLVEIPVIGFLLSPDRTRADVKRFRAWLSVNARSLAIWAALLVGIYLIVKGLIELR